ncbi:TadE/TadG family type IV pilus assembly protein [Bradyrhizobium sp. BWA-3-5]|uniref:TadE/TadG family type IV pilus assembly protein n=1 Tax=Bradyrhizobium sp. BWA-3-5 TaxID=3080013 RepID=UPI00293F0D7B|nr:TadE/TadG family type IV pilus assembly protein [Bradyrhizobium sp. BWA-3-5]WOH65724.1 TadE/TadG family type IV pilus assembly protein [Bradyrhizobium sp. BWA-3-5]
MDSQGGVLVPFSLLQSLSRFRRDRRGNVAVIFAITAIPLISAIGCAVDYSQATRMKAKLQTAADAASIAALSQKSPGFLAASVMTGNGSVSAGVTDANNVFDANMNGITGYQNLVRSSTVTKTGIKLAASVTFTADVPVSFLKVIGFQKLTVTGVSSSAATLPPYLDFYLTLDVSGSMGLPSTPAEQARLGKINPDNWVQYRNSTGVSCTLACHFAPKGSACTDPPVVPPAAPAANPPVTSSYSQQYNTNGYCMGYIYSRLEQAALNSLINQPSTSAVKKQVPGLPVAMLPDLNNTVTPGSPNSLIKGNSKSLPYSLTAVSSCPTDGTNDCIQLRLDAVGYAVNQLFVTANASMKVSNQFRIGLYPFIQKLYAYFPLTSSINGSPTNSSTINYAAANLATLLDTNLDSNLGSGGTHIDTALSSVNNLISGGSGAVGDGSTPTTPQPYVFLVTDGAQDNQYKDVPNGSWHGSNQATTIDKQNTLATVPQCETLKSRGVIVSVLYIPYQPVSPVVTSFAGNEDTYANNNIQYIPASLQKCASPGFFYTANTPADITAALNAMFNHALQTAHLTY